ncbi:MAG: hypothetical protein AB7S26_13680 [Sandaracinaceae bacterium]
MKHFVWFALGIGFVISGCAVDPTYTRCTSSADCEVAEDCFEITTSVSSGRFCSNDCTSDLNCEANLGFNGSCMDPDGMGGICFQECVFDSDCFSSSRCVEFTEAVGTFTNTICMPDN